MVPGSSQREGLVTTVRGENRCTGPRVSGRMDSGRQRWKEAVEGGNRRGPCDLEEMEMEKKEGGHRKGEQDQDLLKRALKW